MNISSHPSRKILIALILLGLVTACEAETSAADTVSLSDCYEVSFLDFTESTDQVSTWRYRVEEQSCAQDLSSWMLELPACATVVDASPRPWEVVQPDPNYQMDGIKWQTGAGFESGEFTVVLSGNLVSGTTRAGVKGPELATDEIGGPACEITTPSPAGTVTLPTTTFTPEVTVTLETPLPPTPVLATATAVPPERPPAGSGPILVTDNHQNLTFTCNGNAVEVRGNGNVVNLLGACSSITVRGNANQVYWEAGSPVVTDTGNENIISQR